MTRLSDAIDRDRFLSLPRPLDDDGEPRRTGVEIEFAGLSEREVAELIRRLWGGEVENPAPYEMIVRDTRLGKVKTYLDTAFRKGRDHAVAQMGLELGREVIPVEIVTEPLTPDQLPEVDLLRDALRQAGALGSRGGMLLSFGVHLNVQVVAQRVETIRPVLSAFALLEDWLRLSDPMDGARRVLPFVDPYPRRFVRALLALPNDAGLGEVIDLYLRLTPTRNRALDMLPLFRQIDPARVEASAYNLQAIKARPTYHYRLPDSRIDEPSWRIAYEWNRWVLVEQVADDPEVLERLSRAWGEHDAAGGATRHDWCRQTERILADTVLSGATA